MNSADQLFDRLLREEHLISFIDAYEILLGDRPKWVTHQHSPKVIAIALQSTQRVFQGLTVQLDALIVSQDRREPPPRHFIGKPYTLEQWRRVFGRWPLD